MNETDLFYQNIHICGLCIFLFSGIYALFVVIHEHNPIHYNFAILIAIFNIIMVLHICYNCVKLYKKQFHKSLFETMIICFVIIFILSNIGYYIQNPAGTYAYVYIIQYIASITFIGIIKCCEWFNPHCYNRCVQSKTQVAPEIILPHINTIHITTSILICNI